MKSQNLAIFKVSKAAREHLLMEPNQWALIERIGRIKVPVARWIVRNRKENTRLAAAFNAFFEASEALEHDGSPWALYDAAKHAWKLLCALPPAKQKEVLDGWHLQQEYPSFAQCAELASHAGGPQWYLSVSSSRHAGTSFFGEVLLDEDCNTVSLRVPIGTSKKDALEAVENILMELRTRWDEAIGHTGCADYRAPVAA